METKENKKKGSNKKLLRVKQQRAARDVARKILGSRRFFNHFLAAVKRQGLVGEQGTALVILLVVVSRLLKRPLNLIVKGVSSSGKNFLVRVVLSLMPIDAVREITSTSAKAWNYSRDAFCHRVVLIQERNESSGPVSPVRLLTSEGKLVRLVTTREDGEWVTKRYVVKGPIAAISTTTKNHLEIDEETRHISLWVTNRSSKPTVSCTPTVLIIH